jgi:hypothetical protein
MPHSAAEAATCEPASPKLAAQAFLKRDEVRPEFAGQLREGTRQQLHRLSQAAPVQHGLSPRVLGGSYTELAAADSEGSQGGGGELDVPGPGTAALPAGASGSGSGGGGSGCHPLLPGEELAAVGVAGQAVPARIRGGAAGAGVISESSGEGDDGRMGAYQSPRMRLAAEAEKVGRPWGVW